MKGDVLRCLRDVRLENAPDLAGDAVRHELDGAVLLRVLDVVGLDHASPSRSQRHALCIHVDWST